MSLHTMSPDVNGEGTRVPSPTPCFSFIDPETGQVQSTTIDPLQALFAQPITDERIKAFMNVEGETWDGEQWAGDDHPLPEECVPDEEEGYALYAGDEVTLIPEDFFEAEAQDLTPEEAYDPFDDLFGPPTKHKPTSFLDEDTNPEN